MANDSAKSLSAKAVVFISYSRKDEPEPPGDGEVAWLTYVQSHLAPAVKRGIFDIFTDQDMEIGTDWRKVIGQKLDTCDICVLLASRHSLASDFILDVEIARLLARQKAEGTPILPILVSAVSKVTTPEWVWALNVRPKGLKPLALFPPAERDAVMAEIVDEIAGITTAIAAKKREREDLPDLAAKSFEIDRLRKGLRGEVEAAIARQADVFRQEKFDWGKPVGSRKLSDHEGAEFLRDAGVWGRDVELLAAARDCGGDPVALGFLASGLTEKFFGDVRRRHAVLPRG
ncbi:putative transmembrane receptor activity [Rhodovulum sp. PH10]|uniref:toll/interleukin-1 receptor domain-containing protein n=1 Tax=Rhodovulum sp. PH10 TaxID=1187851 RepID=UPI00027C2942|nr:toll/interleukin-1 receptor domain-containing protein [Rhodovulum sp. PH10]EJW11206.1 putative transmembrane receptor activity [Rhodovulum sp. PH10]